MRNFHSVIALAVLVIAGSLMGAGPAAAQPDFSTQPVSVADPNVAPQGQPRLLAVTVGHHDAFDRVVFRFSSRAPGYSVRYVSAVTADASGKPVTLEGSAFIRVAMSSVASAQVGAPPAPQGTITPHFPMLQQAKGAGDFEGTVSFGLGLASKSGFRAFSLSGPDRLVVDVAIPTGGGLPATGKEIVPTAIAGLALVLAGAFVIRRASRRRSSTGSAAATG
jgi:LPXTG-motif cell wall-anchored protein